MHDEGEGNYFTLDEHREYGELDLQEAESFPKNEDFLLAALDHLGYVHVQEEGPKTVNTNGFPLHYKRSRTVVAAEKMGGITAQDEHWKVYSAGFNCFPPPKYALCLLPRLVEIDKKGYTITGIVQDPTHAKVNILIPWKLTPIAKELKPYAKELSDKADRQGNNTPYDRYQTIYPWEHLLNSHEMSGAFPAEILFQKFDDGWRIVDEQGQSEKDFVQ